MGSRGETPDTSFKSVKLIESHLLDVMEIDERSAEHKTREIESEYQMFPDQMNMARLGIVYHERALSHFNSPDGEKRKFASGSFEILDELHQSPDTFPELRPFVAAYRSSSIALMAAERRNPALINTSFESFDKAIKQYSPVSYCPEYLRANIAGNLPWFFFSKRKLARQDFESIIQKHQLNNQYAPYRIMSFVYFGWAKLSHSGKYIQQAVAFLDKAMHLDPKNRAAGKKAEELKSKLLASQQRQGPLSLF